MKNSSNWVFLNENYKLDPNKLPLEDVAKSESLCEKDLYLYNMLSQTRAVDVYPYNSIHVSDMKLLGTDYSQPSKYHKSPFISQKEVYCWTVVKGHWVN
uniref:Uncharacterized protein n=1 Tax=Nelumbo nucifera TaxID=4432 RepID=A0A822XPW1_NELNU|nr:TPA_asm: hypothetical protein HUJ06_022429 [Nelumbo nucifera]